MEDGLTCMAIGSLETFTKEKGSNWYWSWVRVNGKSRAESPSGGRQVLSTHAGNRLERCQYMHGRKSLF